MSYKELFFVAIATYLAIAIFKGDEQAFRDAFIQSRAVGFALIMHWMSNK